MRRDKDRRKKNLFVADDVTVVAEDEGGMKEMIKGLKKYVGERIRSKCGKNESDEL